MNLTEMVTNIRIELQDRDQDVWKDDEIERGIFKTVSLMSRLLPRRTLTDIVLATAMFINTDRLIDISTVLPDYIKIERIEYPIDQNPPEYPTYDLLGSGYIRFRKSLTLTDGATMRIEYQTKWTPPTLSASGDYPTHLDDFVTIGAAGQSLIFKAEKYVAEAALAFSDLTAPSAYTFVKPTSPVLPDLPTPPISPTLDFTDITTSLGKIDNELESGTRSSDKYLETGEPLINSNTRGDSVGQTFKLFADVKVAMGRTYLDEAIARIQTIQSTLTKYSADVTSYGSQVNGYANKVSALVGLFKSQGDNENIGASVYASQVNAFVALVNGQQAKAAGLLDVAGRYLASGQAKINEFLAALGIKPEAYYQRSASAQRSTD